MENSLDQRKRIRVKPFRRRKSGEDMLVELFAYTLCAIAFIATVYPIYYCLVISLNEGSDAARGGIFWWPRVPTLVNYQGVLKNRSLMPAFGVSILRTVIGTYASVLFTAMIAYALAHQRLMFRRFYTTVLMISLCFSGGVVPYYVLLKWIGLYDTLWVYIVPSLMGVVNSMLMMNFFGQIPASLEESARMDGAGYIRIFFKIILPVSTPVMVAVALFIAVYHWNDWFSTGFFTKTRYIETAAYRLKDIVGRVSLTSIPSKPSIIVGKIRDRVTFSDNYIKYTKETLRMTVMVLMVLPIAIVYPFLQKYFVKGIMIGSIKG